MSVDGKDALIGEKLLADCLHRLNPHSLLARIRVSYLSPCAAESEGLA